MEKLWVKPELVVLTRSKPEEAVLTHCKSGQEGQTGLPSLTQTWCFEGPNPPCNFCGDPPRS